MRKYYAEQKEKRKAKEKLTRSGPPSEKELVSSVRREMQSREKFKTSTPKIMKAKEKRVISNRIGEPKKLKVDDPKTLKGIRRRRKLDESIFKKAKATQIPASMKKGGFLSTGDDRRDLNIIRTAKNLDDGPASSTSSTTSSSSSNGMKAGGMVKMMKKGGKSTVNKAGNYTKPTMRKALFNRIKAGGKGGRPGQWSARKAQMLAKQYKAKGGGYRG